MKQLKAEFMKMRHTFLIPVHVLVPVISGIVFLAWTRVSAQLQFLVYAEAVGIAFPVLVSVICAGDVETELPGHFQSFLMNPGKRGSISGKMDVPADHGVSGSYGSYDILCCGKQYCVGK